ncbi:cytochrome C [uncultured Campylobacter sp.]|jgi:ompA/motB|nr:cytochrome C [uncultured Campylobacter sp.]
MYRLIEGARYVKATMPKGDASLSWEEAFDVTAYINSKPRKIKPDRKKDFPDLDVKQMDMDVGPYNDGFDENDHRFGPYKRMIKK